MSRAPAAADAPALVEGPASEPAAQDATAAASTVAERVERPEPKPSPELRTRATYRMLTMRGLGADEAANLTAFLVGLQIHNTPWTVDQINRMLFLRQLYQFAGWGAKERRG